MLQMPFQRQNHVGFAFPPTVQELADFGESALQTFQLRRSQLNLPACVRDLHGLSLPRVNGKYTPCFCYNPKRPGRFQPGRYARMEGVPRVLLFAATTGYQIRTFADAARRTGTELTLAT